MDFSYVHIRYFIGYVYHICLQDTIQSTLSLCLRCQAMLLPMPLRPLLLTTRSGFSTISLSLFFRNITLFFSTSCTLAICVKCFISFFFLKTCSPFCAEKPTLFLFVTHFCIQNAVFFYLLKYCLFFFVTDFYVENPVFFFYCFSSLKWSEFLLFYEPPLPCATRVN